MRLVRYYCFFLPYFPLSPQQLVVLPSICLLFFFSIGFHSRLRFFLYYYHLNINVVGYNSVGFIILCTERTAHTGHLYHSLIYYACVYVFVCWLAGQPLLVFVHTEQFCYWLALEYWMCMLVHSHSNYLSNKNTGNISEKSEIKSDFFLSFYQFLFENVNLFFSSLCPSNLCYLSFCAFSMLVLP